MENTNLNAKTVIAIPTYNERENLEWIIGEVLAQAPGIHILIVDDNSPDGTGQLADALAADRPQLHVLHRAGKEGLGPADLPRLLALAHGSGRPDLVIGSRWRRGGATAGWSRSRQLLSRAGSFYVNAVLRLDVADTTAGFRVYRVDFLNRLLQRYVIESKGYGFQIEMTWRSRRAGGKIVEVPITFVERRAGTSKMSGSIIKEAFLEVAKWRIRELHEQA